MHHQKLVFWGVALLLLSASPGLQAKQTFGAKLCHEQGYHCKRVGRGDTWKKLFPDLQVRNMVMTVNRTNTALYRHRVIAVPNDLDSARLLALAPFPRHVNTHDEPLIVVSLKQHAFGAYNAHGNLVHWGAVSGGRGYCRDIQRRCETVTGSFRMYSKRGKYCFSNKFPVEYGGGAPMPYCMFFYKGFAMHASATVPGYHASHGCLRMAYRDARWMSKYFVRIGSKNGTRVIIQK